MANWFYHKDGQQQGPIDWAALKRLADNGQILPYDMVWQEGMAQWGKALDQKGLFRPSGEVAAAAHLFARKAGHRH